MKPYYLLSTSLICPGTREYALSHFSARLMWHRIFDSAPKTESALGASSSSVLREFMGHCAKNEIALDWRRHIFLWRWMTDEMKLPYMHNDVIKCELMAAVASAWAHDQHVDPDQLVIVIMDPSDLTAVGAVRPTRFSDPIKVFRLKPAENSERKFSNHSLVYGVSTTLDIHSWMAL